MNPQYIKYIHHLAGLKRLQQLAGLDSYKILLEAAQREWGV